MAGRTQKSLDSKQVTAHLSPKLARMTREYAANTGQSLSSVIETALRQLFVRIAYFEKLEAEQIIAKLAAEQLAGE